MKLMSQLILASTSPRRKELLSWLGVNFKVVPSHFDESWQRFDDPVLVVEELALAKVRSVARYLESEEERYLILGGDTLIEEGGEIFGKAKTEVELKRMLKRLSGRKHRVLTGIALVDTWSGEERVASEESWVKFIELTEELIERYLKLPVWRGKAGGYAIQQDPLGFVESFEGNLSNIIGLPFGLTKSLLEEMGMITRETEVKWLEDRLVGKLGKGER